MRSRSRGFTLLELLVVVVIIGLVTTGALLAFGSRDDDRTLERETERLAALVRYAREQAELSTREYGLRCEGLAYEFVTFDPRRGIWRSIEEDEILRLRQLPEDLRLGLRIEGREVVLRRPPDEEQPRPQVMLFSNGDVTPFELRLERPGEDGIGVVRSTAQNEIEVDPPGAGDR